MTKATRTRKHYTAVAEREPGWWVITVGIDGAEHATQARRLDQADVMVRDLIAIITDSDPDSFDVTITPHLPDEISAEIERARSLRVEADKLAEEASDQTRAVARHLAGIGLPLRDVGVVLGVSFQRAGQLVGPVNRDEAARRAAQHAAAYAAGRERARQEARANAATLSERQPSRA